MYVVQSTFNREIIKWQPIDWIIRRVHAIFFLTKTMIFFGYWNVCFVMLTFSCSKSKKNELWKLFNNSILNQIFVFLFRWIYFNEKEERIYFFSISMHCIFVYCTQKSTSASSKCQFKMIEKRQFSIFMITERRKANNNNTNNSNNNNNMTSFISCCLMILSYANKCHYVYYYYKFLGCLIYFLCVFFSSNISPTPFTLCAPASLSCIIYPLKNHKERRKKALHRKRKVVNSCVLIWMGLSQLDLYNIVYRNRRCVCGVEEKEIKYQIELSHLKFETAEYQCWRYTQNKKVIHVELELR